MVGNYLFVYSFKIKKKLLLFPTLSPLATISSLSVSMGLQTRDRSRRQPFALVFQPLPLCLCSTTGLTSPP